MKKVVLIILTIGLLFSCTSYHAGKNSGTESLPVRGTDFEVIGNVRVECVSYGVFGLTPELSIIKLGVASSYDELLRQARQLGGHDILNMKVDIERMYLPPLASYRRCIANAIAIRYKNTAVKK